MSKRTFDLNKRASISNNYGFNPYFLIIDLQVFSLLWLISIPVAKHPLSQIYESFAPGAQQRSKTV